MNLGLYSSVFVNSVVSTGLFRGFVVIAFVTVSGDWEILYTRIFCEICCECLGLLVGEVSRSVFVLQCLTYLTVAE